MKAKEHYAELVACKTKEEFGVKLEEIMNCFANDVDGLVQSRHAKTHDAIHSIVSEVNNKWHVMVNLNKKSENKLFDGVLNDDGFYLCLCELRPQYKKYFEKRVQKAKETLESLYQKHEEQKRAIDNMYIHKVMPLDRITESNITMELLSCMAALGSYYGAGMLIEHLKPLAERINFLEYWKNNGINMNEIQEFESDRIGFLNSKMVK